VIELQDVPRRSPNSAFRVYDGQATIVLPDRAEVKVLNVVGSLVWERMDGARTVAEIVDAIVEEYDIAPDEARRDVLSFIEELRESGMVI
jgi:coenzyme PQQ synthesis protein D (PqqD)